MVYAQSNICPGEWYTQTPLGFWHTKGSPNLGQKTRPYNYQQKKNRTYIIVDIAVLTDHRVKLKESEKKDKYLDLCKWTEKTVEHERYNYTTCNLYSWYNYQRIYKGTGGHENSRMSGDH